MESTTTTKPKPKRRRYDKPGHPWKFTPDLGNSIVQAVSAGATFAGACRFVGIGYSTLKEWRTIGARRPEGDPLRTFAADLDKAEATAEVRMVAQVTGAAHHDWKAAAWWLERRCHRDYMKRTKVEGESKEGVTPLDKKKATPEEKKAAAQSILRQVRKQIQAARTAGEAT